MCVQCARTAGIIEAENSMREHCPALCAEASARFLIIILLLPVRVGKIELCVPRVGERRSGMRT